MTSLMAKDTQPGTETNMDVDYVLVYRYADLDNTTAVQGYQKLVKSLASVGFTTEVRNGEEHSLLVFAKLADQQHLFGEVYRSRVKDWLYGVRTAAPDKETEQSLDADPMYPAERLRILYQLITNPTAEGGAGITPGQGEWKGVESIFALHDHEFNKAWIKKWASKTLLKIEDLDEIRDRFGEKIAFYFAFTQSYFTALIGVSILGVSAWTILGNFSPFYGLINCVLCVAFVEYWKYQEEDLAIRWGVKGVSAIELKRHNFKPERMVKDPLTGEESAWFSGPKRLQRQLLQVPFALAAAVGLGTIIALCFGIEIFVSEVYSGPGQSILVFLPTGIITTAQPLILGLLTEFAKRLTVYENYDTETAYDKAMTQKIFILNFITSYLPIILTAFVYVPFATVLVPYLDVFAFTMKPFAENDKQLEIPDLGRFNINPNRLKKQVIYFTVTAQIVNQLFEVVVPYVKRQGRSQYKSYKSKQASKKPGASRPSVQIDDVEEEKTFLTRVRKEAELDIYDVTTDFREMIVQYGYLALFSVVWPLTPLSFLANNWFELRTDAAKICVESKRPTPWRADSIGPWLDSLAFLTWLGSITTAAIVYLFRNGGIGPDGDPSGIRAWALLLTIFFSEHAYMLIQWGTKTFVSKLDSPGRQKERAERFSVRRRYLQESLGAQADLFGRSGQLGGISRSKLEEEARLGSLKNSSVEERFWKRQVGWEESVDVGVGMIGRGLGEEVKKEK